MYHSFVIQVLKASYDKSAIYIFLLWCRYICNFTSIALLSWRCIKLWMSNSSDMNTYVKVKHKSTYVINMHLKVRYNVCSMKMHLKVKHLIHLACRCISALFFCHSSLCFLYIYLIKWKYPCALTTYSILIHCCYASHIVILKGKGKICLLRFATKKQLNKYIKWY